MYEREEKEKAEKEVVEKKDVADKPQIEANVRYKNGSKISPKTGQNILGGFILFILSGLTSLVALLKVKKNNK